MDHKKYAGDVYESELSENDVYTTSLPPLSSSRASSSASSPRHEPSTAQKTPSHSSGEYGTTLRRGPSVSARSPRRKDEEDNEELAHVLERVSTLEGDDLQALVRALLRSFFPFFFNIHKLLFCVKI